MTTKEIINNSFMDYIKVQKDCLGRKKETLHEFLSSKTIDWKYTWLSSEVFGIVTYDDNLSINYGKKILEVMTAIRDRKTFEYIEDENQYNTFILVCNMLNKRNMIEWGTSIRGCWFQYHSGNSDVEFIRCGEVSKLSPDGSWKIVHDEGVVLWSEGVVDYLIDEFFNRGKKNDK